MQTYRLDQKTQWIEHMGLTERLSLKLDTTSSWAKKQGFQEELVQTTTSRFPQCKWFKTEKSQKRAALAVPLPGKQEQWVHQSIMQCLLCKGIHLE
jgi:hypothetical protein